MKKKVNNILKYLEEEFEISRIKDMSLNGLQVGEADKQVKKIGLAVDASLSTFKKAKKQGCDLLITHHGLFWGKEQAITGTHYKRIKYLIENDLPLIALHLPLDLHAKYGNNIELARLLGLKKVKKFGAYHGATIGFSGEFTKVITRKKFISLCENKLGTKCTSLDFGSDKIKKVGIVSGGGSSALMEAKEKGMDVLLTGDGPHQNFHDALDSEINIVYGSHYYTETVGIKALGKALKKKFNLTVAFLDVPARVRI
ncbi:MAG: Nif3-like dinuclear metal center hexameric protein [bacterium]|nr:Nif3-like dinuclear metal center hexameric protein [bacterium]MBU1916561.1 Nif3-like dinuclear metal center hexameric protein [bacterium]